MLSDEQMSKHSVWGGFAAARGYCGNYLSYTFRGWLGIFCFGETSSDSKCHPPGDMVTRMVNHYEQSAVPQQISDPSCPEYEPRKSPEGQWLGFPGFEVPQGLMPDISYPEVFFFLSAYLTIPLGPGRCVFFFGGGCRFDALIIT